MPSICWYVLVVRWNGFGYPQYCHHLVKASWTRLFFSFRQIFTIFDDFSKWSARRCYGTLKIWQKNEEKPCSTSLKHIFWLILSTRKSDFRYPFCYYFWLSISFWHYLILISTLHYSKKNMKEVLLCPD